MYLKNSKSSASAGSAVKYDSSDKADHVRAETHKKIKKMLFHLRLINLYIAVIMKNKHITHIILYAILLSSILLYKRFSN